MRRPRAGNGGFTLLELLIAVTVFSLLAAGLATLLRAGIQIRQRTQAHQDRMRIAEMVLEDIGANLRNPAGPGSAGFRGGRHEMTFDARRIAWAQDGRHRDRFELLTYRYDSGTGRIVKTETDPGTSLAKSHLLCEDGAELRFAYRVRDEVSGTLEWTRDWIREDWPTAVRLELVFREGSGREDVWSRVVPVPRVGVAVGDQE